MKLHSSLILFIYFSNSNVIITVTNITGNTLYFLPIGLKRIKGVRKINLTALKTNLLLLHRLIPQNFLHIKIKGLSKFKRLTLKLLTKLFENKILSLCDLTALPHNGNRKRKKRRV
uniref:ribosomal protein S11 n=1 Tax=Pseudoceramium tenerrimum TaxID=196911 RepID=UPI002E7992C0|nr:ribosomal protein S11 [Pseudoceramium tenerrimum]YP_011017849.1 ribosomal protein S11 [Pseudoceramium tenerrimum]WQF69716.1 ribosomal protein S11 [Pseudoceramium tenerrimum]WQF69725.1 ribosomal protein S11 [Pseudoceramium tenerrimum]WQF69752.1 ribosomal protein S11 [Pseudoceramium tenerrimum]WQF69761.1 ribosomal protein S11 [Pseudoceramium tenerrimum]